MDKIKKIDKPWGYELIWAHNQYYAAKILHIKAGHSLSLQFHKHKTESIYISTGKIVLELDDQSFIMNQGDSKHIPSGSIHRMIAKEDSDIFEVSTPELEDIIRLKDDYGRVNIIAED